MHRVPHVLPWQMRVLVVLLVRVHVREVLVERSTKRDVEHLGSTADPEKRESLAKDVPDEVADLESIPLRLERLGFRVRFRAVPSRFDVVATDVERTRRRGENAFQQRVIQSYTGDWREECWREAAR
jgi:hypothetical protein